MKKILIGFGLQLLIHDTIFAQSTKLIPSKDAFESKWINNERYEMIWYATRDTAKFEMGRVSTENKIVNDQLYVITNVKLKNTMAPWVDSTSADLKTLTPIRHSSYNMQRDMVLIFGETVKGYYKDKTKNSKTEISDVTHEPYFDSNIYPTLIRWIALKDGLKQDIVIYDYNPSLTTGVSNVTIENVESSEYKSKKSGLRNVWLVTIKSDVGKNQTSLTTYYIDKKDRTLWQQQIKVGKASMQIVRIE